MRLALAAATLLATISPIEPETQSGFEGFGKYPEGEQGPYYSNPDMALKWHFDEMDRAVQNLKNPPSRAVKRTLKKRQEKSGGNRKRKTRKRKTRKRKTRKRKTRKKLEKETNYEK